METNENLFGFQQIEASTKSKSTLIIEGVRKEVKEYLLEKITTLIRQMEFPNFYQHYSKKFRRNFTNDGDSDKKRFLRVLTRIFAL